MKHEIVEKNIGLMGVLVFIVISLGGLAEIVPLMFQAQTTQPLNDKVVPYTALQLEGRDVYIREGCNNCHSQMIRPFRSETERYGPYSEAGEFVYDHPFLWGSKRTGPDLARVGGRYSDEWHRRHLNNPRAVVPESNMPGFPWLEKTAVSKDLTATKMSRLKMVGVPYTQADMDGAAKSLEGKTELDALVAYLQSLGLAKSRG